MNNGYNPSQVQEKGKISSFHLSLLAMTIVVSTADVFLPAFVSQESGRDSWIAVIFGTVWAIIIVNIFLTLGLKYPNKTIIQYPCDILGKSAGKLVGVLYLLFYSLIAMEATTQLGEIFIIAFTPEVDISVYNIIVFLVAGYAVKKGLEVIARINELMLPLGLVILVFIVVINIPNMDMKRYLPILYNGLYPSLKGGVLIQAWLLKTVVILQFIPFVSDRKKIRKYTTISIILLGMGLQLGVFVIAVFGPLTGKFMFPALEYVRIASLGEYAQNLDVSIIGVWIAGIFIKVAFFYYAWVHGISQFFGLKSYKNIIVPAGAVILCFSIAAAKRISDVTNFIHFIFPIYSFIMAFVIPAILLVVSTVRDKITVTDSL